MRAEVKGQSGGRVGGGFHLGDLLKTENEISGNSGKSSIWPFMGPCTGSTIGLS